VDCKVRGLLVNPSRGQIDLEDANRCKGLTLRWSTRVIHGRTDDLETRINEGTIMRLPDREVDVSKGMRSPDDAIGLGHERA
jgi:hypothetical protein